LKNLADITDQHHRIAGVDEAGRGPLAGPVVVSAVMLPADFDLPQLDDSKRLSIATRVALYAKIM
jgi:ribonuclease HII